MQIPDHPSSHHSFMEPLSKGHSLPLSLTLTPTLTLALRAGRGLDGEVGGAHGALPRAALREVAKVRVRVRV